MPHLLMISGSLRKASVNTKLVKQSGALWDGEVTFADINMPLYNGDDEDATGVPEAATRLAEQIAAADAVAVSTPEYNQSIPGGLKNALDWVSRTPDKPWQDKPVAIMSAAAGRAGGARAQYALRLALNPFQPVLITGPEVMVAGAHKEFAEDGTLTSDLYRETLGKLMAKLAANVG